MNRASAISILKKPWRTENCSAFWPAPSFVRKIASFPLREAPGGTPPPRGRGLCPGGNSGPRSSALSAPTFRVSCKRRRQCLRPGTCSAAARGTTEQHHRRTVRSPSQWRFFAAPPGAGGAGRQERHGPGTPGWLLRAGARAAALSETSAPDRALGARRSRHRQILLFNQAASDLLSQPLSCFVAKLPLAACSPPDRFGPSYTPARLPGHSEVATVCRSGEPARGRRGGQAPPLGLAPGCGCGGAVSTPLPAPCGEAQLRPRVRSWGRRAQTEVARPCVLVLPGPRAPRPPGASSGGV